MALRSKQLELQQAERELTSANVNLSRARRHREEADLKRRKISPCKGYISQYRREMHQLDNEITALSQQIRQLKSERETIHAQRGEVSDTIKYLRDVLYFWKEFGQLIVPSLSFTICLLRSCYDGTSNNQESVKMTHLLTGSSLLPSFPLHLSG